MLMKLFVLIFFCNFSVILCQFNLISGFGSAGGFLWRPGFRDPADLGHHNSLLGVSDEGSDGYETQEDQEEDDDVQDDEVGVEVKPQTYISRPGGVSYQQTYQSTYTRPGSSGYISTSQYYRPPSTVNRRPGVQSYGGSSYCKNQFGGYTPCHLLKG